MPMKPMECKVCRMMLTSRMLLSEEQHRLVCEGDLASYMEHCPEWLLAKDDTTKNWLDLDNRMTETIALVRAIAEKYFLMPDDPEMRERSVKIERLCFSIMNTMVYLINKICYAPNNPNGNDFDTEYARGRFIKKYNEFARRLEELMVGPFIMGDTLPIHADYLLYACLYDLRKFLPQAFEDNSAHPKIAEFMDKFYSYRSPIRRWFNSDESKTGAYIRPPVPHITTLLQGGMHG